MTLDKNRKTLFNECAILYDEIRPGYPNELIEDVIFLSSIPIDGKILEIGCGTGQATLPFARRGYSMLCLDIGKDLASLAAQRCQQYPKVQILPISFEEWEPGAKAFDLVISATAFHWISPEIGYAKSVKVLKDSGGIAIFNHLHPIPYTGFFQAVQEIYEICAPEMSDSKKIESTEKKIRSREDFMNSIGLFEKVTVKQYPWSIEYNANQYLKLLNTHSDHRILEETKKQKLFKGIAELVKQFGGTITRPYLTVLYFAQKKRNVGIK
jgi:SAM-dependent methyltransferase